MPETPCPERRRLSQIVAKCMATADQIRLANRASKFETVQLVMALQKAREDERLANRALRSHIEEHGCKN